MKDPKDCSHAHYMFLGNFTAKCIDCETIGPLIPIWADKIQLSMKVNKDAVVFEQCKKEIRFESERMTLFCTLELGHTGFHLAKYSWIAADTKTDG